MPEETQSQTIVEGSPLGEKNKKNNLIKIIPIVAFIITILILIVVWISAPTFSRVLIFVIGGVVGIACLMIILIPFIVEYWKNKGKEEGEITLPKAITPEEANLEHLRVCYNKNCGVPIGKVFIEGHQPYGDVNKQMVFWRVYKGYGNNLIYFWAINMHFLNKTFFILGEFQNEKTWPEIYTDTKYKMVIDQSLKRIVTDTERPANTITTKTKNPAMGFESETIEKIHNQPKEKPKPKEDSD